MEPDRAISFGEKEAAILSELSMEVPSHSRSMPQALNGSMCVYISKEDVFKQALQSLSLQVHETRVCTVGNDQVIGSICIDVPPHGDHLVSHPKKIFGDYKATEQDALESAKLAALVYLQNVGIILVDAINLSELIRCEAELKECQRKLLAASSWASLFQERIQSLQTELATAREENMKLVRVEKSVGVKQEVLSSKESVPVKVAIIPRAASTPPPGYQCDTSLLRHGDQRMHLGVNIRKALFKK